MNDRYLQTNWDTEFSKSELQPESRTVSRFRDLRRVQWIFKQLEPQCASKPALKSLQDFKHTFSVTQHMPELMHSQSTTSLGQCASTSSLPQSSDHSTASPRSTYSEHEHASELSDRHNLLPRKPVPQSKNEIASPKTALSFADNEAVLGKAENIKTDGLDDFARLREKKRDLFDRIVDMGRKASVTHSTG